MRIFTKFHVAFKGITYFFKSGSSVKIELLLAVASILGGWYLSITPLEWTIIILCIGLVLAAEAFNTCIEHILDFIHPEQHEMVGKIKDVAAAAVLILSLTALSIGAIIFFPKLLILLELVLSNKPT